MNMQIVRDITSGVTRFASAAHVRFLSSFPCSIIHGFIDLAKFTFKNASM